MKLKYRVKEIQIPHCESVFIAQYRALGIWMTMDNNFVGHFFKNKGKCVCESLEEAKCRVDRYKASMKRARWWPYKGESIVYETEDD